MRWKGIQIFIGMVMMFYAIASYDMRIACFVAGFLLVLDVASDHWIENQANKKDEKL